MDFKDNGLTAWEDNAEFWDNYMGDESNYFHRDIVRPAVEKLLDINKSDNVLDIACGNGNYSEFMAKKGASVTAFDYSPKMIELAKKRRQSVLNKVYFKVCDATNFDELLKLKKEEPFTKAVSNMAIMDISEVKPLFKAVYNMLDDDGIFVFATHHPCFTYENEDYFTSCVNKGVAVEGQPSLQNYYHRSISTIFGLAFSTGFYVDGFIETPFKGDKTPIIMTVRLRKKQSFAIELKTNYTSYKEEIGLALIQNACVEIEIYSIIATVIRSIHTNNISLRDVSNRKASELSQRFKSDSGFPDFVVLERELKQEAEILGCIEAKMPTEHLNIEEEQIKNHRKYFNKVIYTNGVKWIYFDNKIDEKNAIWEIELADVKRKRNLNKSEINWKSTNNWDDLIKKLKSIDWKTD